jgi:hypothetical protein
MAINHLKKLFGVVVGPVYMHQNQDFFKNITWSENYSYMHINWKPPWLNIYLSTWLKA